VWDFGRRTSSRRFHPGVYRYKTIEEMNQSAAKIIESEMQLPDDVL
jgi:hypothetical protein